MFSRHTYTHYKYRIEVDNNGRWRIVSRMSGEVLCRGKEKTKGAARKAASDAKKNLFPEFDAVRKKRSKRMTQHNLATHWGEFLRKLDKADVEVTDWEAKFIESNLDRKNFTEAQIEVMKDMRDRYDID